MTKCSLRKQEKVTLCRAFGGCGRAFCVLGMVWGREKPSQHVLLQGLDMSGALREIRTPDLQVRSLLLYPAGLLARIVRKGLYVTRAEAVKHHCAIFFAWRKKKKGGGCRRILRIGGRIFCEPAAGAIFVDTVSKSRQY